MADEYSRGSNGMNNYVIDAILKRIEGRLITIENKVDEILQNHIPHLTAEMAGQKRDIEWLRRGFWFIAGASSSAILGTLGYLLNLLIV